MIELSEFFDGGNDIAGALFQVDGAQNLAGPLRFGALVTADRQDRTRRLAHNLFGNAAEQEPSKAAAAMGPHDDQTDVVLLGIFENPGRRIERLLDDLDRTVVGAAKSFDRLCERRFGLSFSLRQISWRRGFGQRHDRHGFSRAQHIQKVRLGTVLVRQVETTNHGRPRGLRKVSEDQNSCRFHHSLHEQEEA